MWLINTASLALEAVIDSESCTYAILSHTWADGEVTFQEFAQLSHARAKPGFSKIEQTCQLARERGIEYAWVDTCCKCYSRSNCYLLQLPRELFVYSLDRF
jgi:hypothetical protein